MPSVCQDRMRSGNEIENKLQKVLNEVIATTVGLCTQIYVHLIGNFFSAFQLSFGYTVPSILDCSRHAIRKILD